MSRPVKEWTGATDATRVPKRVRMRILERESHACHECQSALKPTDKVEFDHRPALINGGENRESMIFPVHAKCHKERTKKDVAEKAKVAAVKAKHHGIRDTKPKIVSRGFPKAQPKSSKIDKSALPALPRRGLFGGQQ